MLWRTSIPLAIGIVFVSHMLLLYPTLRANSTWLGPVVTRFRSEAKEVWLTIDDGPDDDTLAILDLLARHGARATFFVKGIKAEQRPDLLQAIHHAGSSVGNHSQTHPSSTFWLLGPRRLASEIDGCSDAIASALASRPRLFRAPVGMKNPFVHPLLARRDLRLIGWSARGFDGVSLDPGTVVERILPDVRPGAILLLHQGRSVDRTPVSVVALQQLLAELTARGYRCVIPAESALL